jgi:hypothetical protein
VQEVYLGTGKTFTPHAPPLNPQAPQSEAPQ